MVDLWDMVSRSGGFSVLDRLRLFIPFRVTEVAGGDRFLDVDQAISGDCKGLVDLERYGTRLDGAISIDEDGRRQVESLRHPWEKLPTSFTPMAFKIHNNGFSYPGVELKASPAKLLQGHNVFGPVSIQLGGMEMLTLLSVTYPRLFDALDVGSTEVYELDATYSARLPNEAAALAVCAYLKNVSKGHRKARGDTYQTSNYWGAKESRYSGLKAYLKGPEYEKQLDEQRKLAEAGDRAAQRVVQIMGDPRLVAWVQHLIRWEATIKKRYMVRRGIPTRWVDLCKYQIQQAEQGTCVLEKWWGDITRPIFESFEGATMRVIDDKKVMEALKAKHLRVSKSGKISYSYAMNLYRTFRDIREYGWEQMQETMSCKRTFNRHVKDIAECGISRAQLQNLKGHDRTNNIVPILRFVNVDFSAQRPDWYVEPVSQFQQAAAAA
jgi:II/X family phage/plasmid replication protein